MVVVPIVKNKTGLVCDTNNYRPISLATITAKVFDSLLNTQLNKYVKIHDNQFGFRPGLSTESAILCLKQTVSYYTDRKTTVYACFLDLSKAFDLVSYDILWEKLRKEKVPTALISVFQYWYGKHSNVVKWINTFSRPYRMECGVRQGGLSSPSLFNLYINALIEELSGCRVGCHIDRVCVNNISYADDMALLSASPGGLAHLLGICEKYAASHGLLYNTTKSECMVFGLAVPESTSPVRAAKRACAFPEPERPAAAAAAAAAAGQAAAQTPLEVDKKCFNKEGDRHICLKGVSIDVIKKTAGWTGNSLVFSKFYNMPLPVVEDLTFANAVLDE
ncbi:unnamed protein product [Plutella xylostella]|uniref:(diamondback moth) hypothetical protein n=1 Tax=Plutella xylostella TaxID=51655 RepID=A0A8S4GG39_PLUXY|nr:unnamed protein product [Plutella xylostella]